MLSKNLVKKKKLVIKTLSEEASLSKSFFNFLARKLTTAKKFLLHSKFFIFNINFAFPFCTGEFSKKCNYNGCPLLSMLKCAKCGRAYYCSTEHKREHWSEHRAICHKPPWKL